MRIGIIILKKFYIKKFLLGYKIEYKLLQEIKRLTIAQERRRQDELLIQK